MDDVRDVRGSGVVNARWNTAAIVCLLCVRPALSASFDCKEAYTRFEQTICGNARLSRLDHELGRISERAVELDFVTGRDIRQIRNMMARKCRLSEELDNCLIDTTEEQIGNLAVQLGEATEVPASSKYAGQLQVWIRKVEMATNSLNDARDEFRQSGDPEPVVAATVKLLQVYKLRLPQHQRTSRLKREIKILEVKLRAGCNNQSYGRAWHRALLNNGRSCSAPLRNRQFGGL